MVQPLAPCPTCKRHARITETTCPFCRTTLPASFSKSAAPGTSQRLTRAAAAVFGATVAVTGCGGDVKQAQSDAGSSTTGTVGDGGGFSADYGAPPPPEVGGGGNGDGGAGGIMSAGGAGGGIGSIAGAGGIGDGGDGYGGIVALYGGPGIGGDGGSGGEVGDTGGFSADYGAPPPIPEPE